MGSKIGPTIPEIRREFSFIIAKLLRQRDRNEPLSPKACGEMGEYMKRLNQALVRERQSERAPPSANTLTEAQIKEIKHIRATTTQRLDQIAGAYNVNIRAIYDVLHEVPEEEDEPA